MTYQEVQDIEGIQIIPIDNYKVPTVKVWQKTKKKYSLTNTYGIGLVCGGVSGNVQAIDLDLKYDLKGTLLKDYCEEVKKHDKTLLDSIVIQETVSKGYHFIFRCDEIEGNKKLAQRPATETEIIAGDKVMVLLETRGEGGYIAIYPTPGYKLKKGSFDKIGYITPIQRKLLLDIAYTFDEMPVKEFTPPKFEQKKQSKGLKPSEDYNERGDIVGLLVEYGWTIVGHRGPKILLRRPGDTKALSSGNYDEDLKRFSIFSTSTEFESQHAYQPYAVYGMLKCNGDWTKVPKMLYDEGYGDRMEDIKQKNESIPSLIDVTDDDLSFLATENDYDDYLNSWRTGNFEMGKSTGIPTLDTHFLFKEGNLVIINGVDNVGKSSVVWYMALLSSIFHQWKWLIFSSENRVGGVVRKLIEFYWCEKIENMSDEKYLIAKKFVKDNFDIIKASDKLYNYQDILNMATKALKKKTYKGLMVDPYNSLKVDMPKGNKNDAYAYHYEAASVIQLFAKQNNISIYLNCHVGTVGARNKDKNGYTKAPQKEDTEGGVMFANKADEFLTIHRITQHDKLWMFTEIHVRKVKETETGGKVTYFFEPVDLRMINYQTGFETAKGRHVEIKGFNPVLEWHKSKGVVPIDFTESRKDQEINLENYDPSNQQPMTLPF